MNQKSEETGKLTLRVNEIFYSLQGEGARSGSPNIFIRLSGCKLQDACFLAGIECDTEFESGKEMTLQDIYNAVCDLQAAQSALYPCRWLIWTGGEPLDQLTERHFKYFNDDGFYQAIETNGSHPIPENLDYVTISPKVAEHVLIKLHGKRPGKIDELRYVRAKWQTIPNPSLTADHYCLSPHFDGDRMNGDNIRHCIQLVKENPQWQLSIQLHKILQIR